MDRMNQGKDNLDCGLSPMRKEAISGLVPVLAAARRIYLIAQGAETVLAEYMGYHLEKQFPDVHILSQGSAKLCHAGAGDVAVVFSFPPYSGETEEMAKHCRNAGAKVIGITNSERASVCTYCDNCLFVNAEKKPYGYSLTRPIALVEEILVALRGNENEI